MFTIHPQLLKDCHHLGKFDLCHILLHKNALLHWFLLVPETSTENLLDLPSTELQTLMDNAQCIHHVLKNDLNYSKTNMGSLGNVVSQLHLHIIGRRHDDACWPQPVWGNLNSEASYSIDDIEKIKSYLPLNDAV